MKVMAQVGMVMNLDKCIGCHTCSVTCKQAWTNRAGVEYAWFNNVETRPGQGYPRTYQDQEKWQGGWVRTKSGRLKLRSGGRFKKLLSIFASPVQPEMADYYEPWTYDYENLVQAPLGDDFPVARPKSLITGDDMAIKASANWQWGKLLPCNISAEYRNLSPGRNRATDVGAADNHNTLGSQNWWGPIREEIAQDINRICNIQSTVTVRVGKRQASRIRRCAVPTGEIAW